MLFVIQVVATAGLTSLMPAIRSCVCSYTEDGNWNLSRGLDSKFTALHSPSTQLLLLTLPLCTALLLRVGVRGD